MDIEFCLVSLNTLISLYNLKHGGFVTDEKKWDFCHIHLNVICLSHYTKPPRIPPNLVSCRSSFWL